MRPSICKPKYCRFAFAIARESLAYLIAQNGEIFEARPLNFLARASAIDENAAINAKNEILKQVFLLLFVVGEQPENSV